VDEKPQGSKKLNGPNLLKDTMTFKDKDNMLAAYFTEEELKAYKPVLEKNTDDNPEQVKRKRGRPRKNPELANPE